MCAPNHRQQGTERTVRLRRGGERSVQTNARWTYGDTTSTEVCVHYPTDFSVSHTVITATQRHRTLEKRMCAPGLRCPGTAAQGRKVSCALNTWLFQ